MTDTGRDEESRAEVAVAGVFLRGMAMGAADVVPGVSGGTIALITGIYGRLIDAISAVGVPALRLFLAGRWAACWRQVDGTFLLVLVAGIGSAVFLLAGLINHALATYPLPLWSFFFGLVLASAVFLLRQELPAPAAADILPLVLGLALSGWIALSPGFSFPQGQLGFFLAGMLAICAMILPGISGSFILLLLGMYGPVIAAVTGLDIPVLAVFVAGCVIGLMLFSRVIAVLLHRLRRGTMAALAGCLLGSLLTLWPWQRVLATVIDRHGELRVVHTHPISPVTYATEMGPSLLPACVLAALVGVLLVLAMHLLDRPSADLAKPG